MDFSDLLNTLFGPDWVKAVLQVASSAIGIVMAIIVNKFKNKVSYDVITNNTQVKSLLKLVDSLIKNNEELKEQNKLLTQETENIKSGVIAIGDIVAASFMDSKAVSSDTKVKICTSIDTLSKLGLDLKATNQVVDSVKTGMELTVETVNDIKESIVEANKKQKQEAEGTVQTSLELYNEILNEQ